MSQAIVIVDRFEGEYAVMEIDGVMNIIRRCDIPTETREGDVLRLEDSRWMIDREETEKRKKEIKDLADKLWE